MTTIFLEKQNIIITPNNRLAKYLETQYSAENIFPIKNWLEDLYRNSKNAEYILSDIEEKLLWQEIIALECKDFMYNTALFANESQKAWRLLQEWEIDFSEILKYQDAEILAFHSRIQRFIKYCREKNLIDRARIPKILINALIQKKITLPCSKIIFFGFVETIPIIRSLQNALKTNGIEILEIEPKTQENVIHKYLAADTQDEEISTMARFAYDYAMKNNHRTIGCVVPNLDKLRDTIERTFQNIFSRREQTCLFPTFNISLGKPLANYSIIDIALQLLALNLEEISFSKILYLLHSPFWGFQQCEKDLYIKYETLLFKAGSSNFTLAELISLLKHVNKNSLLINVLEKYNQKFNEIKGKTQPFIFWKEFFESQLEILNWPGERALNSEEFQLHKRFTNLLTEFLNLNLTLDNATYSKAVKILKEIAAKCLFQPEQKNNPNVHILGALEALDLNFDCLWIMEANNENFPKPPRPNSILPLKLQKEKNLPHSSISLEIQYTENILARFANSAPEIIYSFSKRINDCDIKLSPLIANIPNIFEIKLSDLHLLPAKELSTNQKFIEKINDEIAPPLELTAKISGGVKILKLQALCPFRAFAECRLKTKELSEPEAGISKLDRGNIIHSALEKIWQEIKSQKNLLAALSCELSEIIAKSIETACSNWLIKHVNKNSFKINELIKIEQKFLQNLLTQWLKYEKERPPFSIEALEKRIDAKILGLPFELHIDRIDRLENGDLVIIDYKTGMNIPKNDDFLGDRPSEPQLPLYCIFYLEPVSGFAFAIIRSDKLRLATTVIDNNLLREQQKVFEKLAADFCAGNAKIDPKDGAKTCERCALKMLCRINY